MRQFVSEQVYAMRRYAGEHGRRSPAGRLGFSWQPCNRQSAAEEDCGPVDAAFRASLDPIAGRIGEAIRAYGDGGRSPADVCRSPRSAVNWCRGRLPGASFTEAWTDFSW